MKKSCKRLQMMMADKGPHSLRDDRVAQEHLAECTACFEFLEAHAMIHEKLSDTSLIDAPDDVVNELVAYVAEQSKKTDVAGDPIEKNGLKPSDRQSRILRSFIETAGKHLRKFLLILYPFRRKIAFGFVAVMVCGITFSLFTPTMMTLSGKGKLLSDLNYPRGETELVEPSPETSLEQIKGYGQIKAIWLVMWWTFTVQ